MSNELGGHGKGEDEVGIPDAYAEPAINLFGKPSEVSSGPGVGAQLLETQAARDDTDAPPSAGSPEFPASDSDIPF